MPLVLLRPDRRWPTRLAGAVVAGTVAAAAADPPAVIKTSIGPGAPERLADFTSTWGPLEVTTTGQVSIVGLLIDDGESTRFRLGDNTAAPTLTNTTVGYPVHEDLVLAFIHEVSYPFNASSTLTQDERWISPRGFDHRRLEFSVQHDTWGKLWLGKGHMAADTVTQIDLSGTAMAGHNTISDHGGGLRFRDRDTGRLTSTTIAAVFPDLDGDRLTRVRYDAAGVGGFTLSGSYSDLQRWDVSVRFQQDAEDTATGRLPGGAQQVRAGLAFQDDSHTDGNDTQSLVGSASAAWAGGFTLTLSGGQQFAEQGPDGQYTYAKLGWRGRVLPFGATAVSVDGWLGFDFVPGIDRAQAVGLQLAQSIDGRALELFASLRHHWLEGDADLEPIGVLLTGFRLQF